jgi:rifampicin phosphotransferase
MANVIRFDQDGALRPDLVGGKAASLGRASAMGFKVPPGFSVTTAAHSEFLAGDTLAERIHPIVASLDLNDAAALESRTGEIRALITTTEIPPAIVADIKAAYASFGDDVFVAVRSSGTAEDLAGASFAGMYDTYLDMCGFDAVIDAVRRCWASMWTARVTAYRQQQGFDGEHERLAVVVQQMVAADVAGVMFTANPMTSRTDEIVINASWGLGEGVVSGILNPDTFVIDRTTLAVKSLEVGDKEKKVVRDPESGRGTIEQLTSAEERSATSLEPVQAEALSRLGRDVMQQYGGLPQDIEWALSDGTLYLLQSRPVTGVEFTWDEDVDGWQPPAEEADTTWTYTWSEMYWTGGISPLFYSCRAYECYLNYSRFAKLFGFKDVANVRWHKYHRATAYFNADAERSWLSQQWPGQLRDLTNIPPAWHDDFVNKRASVFGLLQMWLRVHILQPEHGVTRWFQTTYDYLDNRTDEADGPSVDEIRAMSDVQLVEAAEQRVAFVDEWYVTLWPPFFFYATGALGGLAKLLEHWYDGDTATVFQDLISGIPDNKAALEGEALFELAQMIGTSPALKSLFEVHRGKAFFAAVAEHDDENARRFAAGYAEFIHQHGHRGHQDRDFYYDRRVENSALDYDAFEQLLNADNPVHPSVMMDKLVKRREAVVEEVSANLAQKAFGKLRAKIFRYVADYCLRFLKYRDDERHYLDRLTYGKKKIFLEIGKRMYDKGAISEADDFWFLARHELYDYLNGETPAGLCKAKMAARKAVFHRRNERNEPTPTWLRNGVPVDLSSAVENAEDLPEGTLVGIATSHGIASGLARVVPQLDQIGRVENGDILVCNSTDPGWMSVFPKIRGLVLETGGILAHGACLSREYGIPAVQVRDAMRQIEDAVHITVDGNSARVYPCDESDGERAD